MSGASMDLKNRIATSIDLSDTLSILFLVDVARRLHVPKTMVLDWQQSGVFCGHEYVDGGNHQIYYLSDECQGEQHYKSVAWFGGDAAFQVRKEHDRRKKEYAISHDISFVEIPHTCIQYDDVADLLAVSGLR